MRRYRWEKELLLSKLVGREAVRRDGLGPGIRKALHLCPYTHEVYSEYNGEVLTHRELVRCMRHQQRRATSTTNRNSQASLVREAASVVTLGVPLSREDAYRLWLNGDVEAPKLIYVVGVLGLGYVAHKIGITGYLPFRIAQLKLEYKPINLDFKETGFTWQIGPRALAESVEKKAHAKCIMNFGPSVLGEEVWPMPIAGAVAAVNFALHQMQLTDVLGRAC